MGWRKSGDDGQELGRSLDLVLDGVLALKNAVRRGQRLDGEGEKMFSSTDMWCPSLCRTSAVAPPNVEDAKLALRRMKDAKLVLASISNSLDDAIQALTNSILRDCRAAGLASLPDELLAHIFEMYIETRLSVGGYFKDSISPHILASVCQRFRRITVRLPDLWKHVSLSFPEEQLLFLKYRYKRPAVHIQDEPSLDLVQLRAKSLDLIHSFHQWRELHLRYSNEDHGHLYFEHLRSRIQTPFEELEFLKIHNEVIEIDGEEPLILSPIPISIHEIDSRTLSSWEMPALTHLELQNVLPSMPLQCQNVTQLSIVLDVNFAEVLGMGAFQILLQSMPRIESFSITFDAGMIFDNLVVGGPPILPCLTSLDTKIYGKTPALLISQFMALVATQNLTILKLELRPHQPLRLEEWMQSLFPRPTAKIRHFACVEDFALEIHNLEGSSGVFEGMFQSLPCVQHLTLTLPTEHNLLLHRWLREYGGLHDLRTLHINVPANSGGGLASHALFLSLFLRAGEKRVKFEKLEVRIPASHPGSACRAGIASLIGEKLHWNEF